MQLVAFDYSMFAILSWCYFFMFIIVMELENNYLVVFIELLFILVCSHEATS